VLTFTGVLLLLGIFALAALLLAVPRLLSGRGQPPDDEPPSDPEDHR
jgi:hypothetical protein